MTSLEFINEFDVLYNNITSNQAPGLDDYEKSVFLTKAQDEIIKSYFNPKLNKTLEGFDDSEVRQIDFSMILNTVNYTSFSESIIDYRSNSKRVALDTDIMMILNEFIDVDRITNEDSLKNLRTFPGVSGEDIGEINPRPDVPDGPGNLEQDIVTYTNRVRLTVVPLDYKEYAQLMSKPFKRPTHYQAWRLLDSSSSTNSAELVVGPQDTIKNYVVRYIRRPKPIILSNLDGLTIDKESKKTDCELDPILHREILQRAVELAKAAYVGDINTQIALGTNSQTNMGIIQQAK